MNYSFLVNRNNPLNKDYQPDDLYVTDNNDNNFHNYLDPSLKPMLSKSIKPYVDALINDAKKDGFSIIVDSGYRSYQYQETVLQNLIKEKGEEAYVRSALPGTSEHQTGLAFDFAYFKDGIYSDDVTEVTPEAIWMQNNSYKYGFILRYPKGKESITGYTYEPWHFRFVGLEVAKTIFEDNLTLEEYHQNLTNKKKLL